MTFHNIRASCHGHPSLPIQEQPLNASIAADYVGTVERSRGTLGKLTGVQFAGSISAGFCMALVTWFMRGDSSFRIRTP